MNEERGKGVYGLIGYKKRKFRSGYTKYEGIAIDGNNPPDIKLYWTKGGKEKVLTFKQGQKPQGGAEQILYKEREGFRREDGGVAEWKITGMVTIENRPDIPPKKETITFKFREQDNPVIGQGHEVSYLRKLIMGPGSEDPSEFSGRKTVAFDPDTDEKLVGGKRRKTRKQRKSRKGGKKSRKQRKSRKSSKKSHKCRTRKRRTR